VLTSAVTVTAKTRAALGGTAGDGSDARDGDAFEESLAVVAEPLHQVVDGAAGREDNRVDTLLEGRDERFASGGRNGLVDRHHFDLEAGVAQRFGEDLACHQSSRQQDPTAAVAARLEDGGRQLFGHEAGGHDVGSDPSASKGGRGRGADGGHLRPAERASVALGGVERSPEPVDAVRAREDDQVHVIHALDGGLNRGGVWRGSKRDGGVGQGRGAAPPEIVGRGGDLMGRPGDHHPTPEEWPTVEPPPR